MKKAHCEFFVYCFFHQVIFLSDLKNKFKFNDFEIFKCIIQYDVFNSSMNIICSNVNDDFSQYKFLFIEWRRELKQWHNFAEKKRFLNLNNDNFFIFTNKSIIAIYFIYSFDMSFDASMIKTKKKQNRKKKNEKLK